MDPPSSETLHPHYPCGTCATEEELYALLRNALRIATNAMSHIPSSLCRGTCKCRGNAPHDGVTEHSDRNPRPSCDELRLQFENVLQNMVSRRSAGRSLSPDRDSEIAFTDFGSDELRLDETEISYISGPTAYATVGNINQNVRNINTPRVPAAQNSHVPSGQTSLNRPYPLGSYVGVTADRSSPASPSVTLTDDAKVQGYYVVLVGRNPNIYVNADDAIKQTNGIPNGYFVKHKTMDEAQNAFSDAIKKRKVRRVNPMTVEVVTSL